MRERIAPRIAVPVIALGIASAAALPAAGAAPPGDLDLEVRHTIVSVGADGVTRTSEFAERVHRRDATVWVERVLPLGAHDAQEHAAHSKEHRHVDLSTAARWITRDGEGVRLRLVLAHDRLVLEVPAADRASVGFEGDWETASRFIRAKALAAMTRLSQATAAGRWYEGRTPEGTTRVLWDERDGYPRRVESRNAAGTVIKTSVADRIARPATAPWTRLDGYTTKEYSDVLD